MSNSQESNPPLSASEKLRNLDEGLNLSSGRKDLLLHGKGSGYLTERVMEYVEKKLGGIPVSEREEALRYLKTEVDFRYLMERDKPGIGKAEVRHLRSELLGFAEEELARVKQGAQTNWAASAEAQRRCRHIPNKHGK